MVEATASSRALPRRTPPAVSFIAVCGSFFGLGGGNSSVSEVCVLDMGWEGRGLCCFGARGTPLRAVCVAAQSAKHRMDASCVCCWLLVHLEYKQKCKLLARCTAADSSSSVPPTVMCALHANTQPPTPLSSQHISQINGVAAADTSML